MQFPLGTEFSPNYVTQLDTQYCLFFTKVTSRLSNTLLLLTICNCFFPHFCTSFFHLLITSASLPWLSDTHLVLLFYFIFIHFFVVHSPKTAWCHCYLDSGLDSSVFYWRLHSPLGLRRVDEIQLQENLLELHSEGPLSVSIVWSHINFFMCHTGSHAAFISGGKICWQTEEHKYIKSFLLPHKCKQSRWDEALVTME
jgi:hypothetical protein